MLKQSQIMSNLHEIQFKKKKEMQMLPFFQKEGKL